MAKASWLDDIDVVLFDAGGTLIELDFAHIAELAAARGHEIGIDPLRRGEVEARREIDARAARSGGTRDSDADRLIGYFRHVIAGAGLDAEAADRIASDVVESHRAANLWRIGIEGALETALGLRERGHRTAVVSNADGRAAAVLEGAGLAGAFEAIVDSHDEGVEKPDPEIFLRALGRLDAAPERAVYVGDIYSIDVLGARGAGLRPVLVDPFDSFGAYDCPRIRTLSELLAGPGPPTR